MSNLLSDIDANVLGGLNQFATSSQLDSDADSSSSVASDDASVDLTSDFKGERGS